MLDDEEEEEEENGISVLKIDFCLIINLVSVYPDLKQFYLIMTKL